MEKDNSRILSLTAREILLHSFDAVFLVDGGMRVIFQNNFSREAFGDRTEERCCDFLGPNALPCDGCPLAEVPAVPQRNVLVHESDGHKKYFDMHPGPVKDESGLTVGCLNVGRDITDEREREELKKDSLSMLSHDLKSPLTAIQGFAELLLDKDLDIGSEEREMLDLIKKTASRTSVLVEEFITLSRIESGRVKNQPMPVSFSALVDFYIEKYHALARLKDLKLNIEIPPSVPKALLDEQHFGRVLSNLLNNAIAYSGEGGGIWIRAGVHDGDPASVYLEVADDGPGIPEDILPHLFDRYHTVKKRMKLSSGLGLAIVKALTELQGGRVEARSAAGSGTAIRLVFPACTGEEGARC